MGLLTSLFVLCVGIFPQQEVSRPDDLRHRMLSAYTKAGDWLVSGQSKEGAWLQGPPGRQAPSVAYTSLAVDSLSRAPKELQERYQDSIRRGADYIFSRRNEDGSFGEGPTGAFLKTYATAVALMALHSADSEKYADAIRGAQAYLKQNQLKEGEHLGGSGYGDDKPFSDKKTIANLSTTGFTAEALKDSGLPQDDEFWKLVVTFVRKCQNNSETNTDKEFVAKLKAAGLSVGNDGGLYYSALADPKLHKAGTVKVIGVETIKSYGSMTYHGIKTYIYAGLGKDSPEVKSAIDWARKNYSVDAHPGFPHDKAKRSHLRGLYYYLLVMTRALDAIGERPFRTFDGKEHDWPVEVAEHFLSTMKNDTMWVNENPAWWENDPLLVTSYVLKTLDTLFPYIK